MEPATSRTTDRLTEGSLILLRQYRSWTLPGHWKATAARLIGQPTTAAAAVYVAGYESLLLAVPAAGIGWCVAAWIVADDDADEDDDAEDYTDDQDDGEDQGPDATEMIPPAEFVELVRALIGDGSGVHLVEVADRLAEIEPGHPWDTADVRELAHSADIVITPTRSRTRPGSSTGIRARDLPTPSPDDETAPESVVAAGHPANNNTNTLAVERHGEGMWIMRDPADAARHHRVRQHTH